MEITILRPCAITIDVGGSATQRLSMGESFKSDDELMIRRMKSLVSNGFAMEVQGNAVKDVEVKAKPAPRRRKAAPKVATEKKVS